MTSKLRHSPATPIPVGPVPTGPVAQATHAERQPSVVFQCAGFRRLWITRSGRRHLFYFGRMRIANPHWAPAAAMAVLALLALTGCQSTPTPVPTSTATADAPVFASDEEALAAATGAYAAYLRVSDSVASDGGSNPARYEEVAEGEALANGFESARQFRDSAARSVGATRFEIFKLQNWADSGSGEATVSFYLCDDVSELDVVTPDGTSIVSPDRPDRTPFQVEVVVRGDSTSRVLTKDVWKGSNFC